MVDFKYGMGVQVFAEANEQMMIYALGLLNKYDMIGKFSTVRMVIAQPRLEHFDEWSCTVDDLCRFAQSAKEVVQVIQTGDWNPDDWAKTEEWSATGPIIPDADSCRFCKAKATCPALKAQVRGLVLAAPAAAEDFDDLTALPVLAHTDADDLGRYMDKVGLLEDFAKAIRAEVERRLLSGQDVPSPQGGYKLVQGKRGNRAWTSDDEVTALLKSMRFKNEDIFTFKLKGPAPIEKLLAKDSPTRWKRLSKFIGQSEGKPSVAPMSDGRPAITAGASALDFEDLTQSVEDLIG